MTSGSGRRGNGGGVGRRSIAMLVVGLVLLGCASPPSLPPSSSSPSPSARPSPSPTAAPLSAVRFTTSGLERCTPWPYGCLYAVLVRDASGTVRTGWFDTSATAPNPRSPVTAGDVPSTLAAGAYFVTIQKQLVTDVGSFSPVPNGTPVVSFVQDVLIACSVSIDVAAGAPVTIDVAFTESRCAASVGG